MTPGLNECLRAAGLQHYYARFTSVGVHHAAHLSALTIEDYPILGIHTMEDRTRLFHLVQMVKSLDLEALRYENGDDYDTDGGDEGYALVNGSFTYGGYGDPDKDVYDDEDERRGTMNESNAATFTRSSCVRRRLDFSCENINHHQKLLSYQGGPVPGCTSHDRNNQVQNKGSATPLQHDLDSGSAVLCRYKQNHNHRKDGHSRPSYHHVGGNTEPHIIGGAATRLSPTLTSLHKQKPRPATVASKRFDNKPDGHKDRKRISKKEMGHNGEIGNMAKPTPVYESQRTAGYNYGVPQSFPPLSNKKQEGKQQISVCVRKRPLTHAESRRGEADVVTTSGDECVIVHESKEAVDLTQYILQHRFYFDKVFGEESSNEEVYQQTAYPLVQHMLNGGKATCFAYGQTGAGKTHTMLGSSPGRPGLYALAVQDIFAHLSTTRIYSPLLVYVSFFEIYCGQLYDLLDHRKRLFAREDGQKVVHIAGLRNVQVDSVSSLLEVISQGTEERTQGTSGVNPLSSRSHALLQIQLRSPNQQIAGRMWFVDLAGSERASDTKEPDRQSRMEAAEINQSLLALKECIRSLDQEQSHTPFRQSKLTQVLKDSFVGDSMTCMIANISPGHSATEHTLNTLRYADRVKELRGQRGLRGGRRSKTIPSPKHNLSNSSGSSVSTRGKSPPKKEKLGRQRKAFTSTTPGTRLATGDAVLCSTPKSSRWKTETNASRKTGIGLEHITPIGGWLAMGDKSHGREEAGGRKDRGRESETHGRTNSHSVGDQNTTDTNLLGAHESLTQRESGIHHREKENQHHAVKMERQERRRWRNQLRQMESSRDTGSEVERLRERDFKKVDEWNKEKQRHLRQYHLQLQHFIPLTASSSGNLLSPSTCPSLSSSCQASLSSYVSPLSSSSLQHSSHSSASALMYHSLEGVLEACRAGVEFKAGHNKGQLSFHLQTETSPSCNNNNDEDACGDCGGVGEDFGLSWEGQEIRFCQRSESEKRGGAVGAPGETLERKEERRPARMEGGERRWAWVAPTETEQTDTMTGATSTNVVAQVSHNCHSEDRGHVDEEGVDSSDVPADGVWRSEEEGRAESYSLVSNPGNNNSNSLFNHPPFESPHWRAPAERPLSPACEHINALLMPNTQSDSNHAHCSKANMSDLPPDETSPSHIMSPLSISLLQVDQQVATASFLVGEQNTNSRYERGEGNRREVEKEHHLCSGIAEKVVEDEDVELRLSLLELPQPKTNCPPSFETITAVHHIEQGKGRMKPPLHEALQVSLQHQDNSQKPQTIPVLEKMKSISPLVHHSGVTNSSSSMPNGATQILTEYTCKMHNKSAKSSISAAQSEHVLNHYHTAHSNNSSNSNTPLKPKSPAESKSQESMSNHQIRPVIRLSALEDLDYAQWHVVQAHWEQLEEMEDLRHREGTLLCQQPDMAFVEYVHKLEEIMERKAWCIRSMRAQLQPYLKPVHFNQSQNQSEYNNNYNT